MSNTQNIAEKRNTQNETTNTINLNPSNNIKCELVKEDTSNTKSNPPIQQKEHKKFPFIIGDSMVKDIDGYLLTGSIKRKFIVNVRLMMICRWTPLTSHDQAEIDHIRLVFFQIRVESQKRVHPVFSFLFVLTSPGLRTNHNAGF